MFGFASPNELPHSGGSVRPTGTLRIEDVNPHRSLALAALTVCGTLLLSGCAFLEPSPVATPTPTVTAIDSTRLIGGSIDPRDTVWSGTDSGGDLTTLTLHADGTVAISYGDNAYDYPGDTWDVRDEMLHVAVYLNETQGTAYYSGTWNPETGAFDMIMRTSKTAQQLTVTLTQQ